MSDTSNRDPVRRTAVVVGVSLAIAALVTWFTPDLVAWFAPDLFGPHKPGGHGGPPIPDLFIQLKLFVSTYNLVALGFLAGTYAMLYRELPNRFTLSLPLYGGAAPVRTHVEPAGIAVPRVQRQRAGTLHVPARPVCGRRRDVPHVPEFGVRKAGWCSVVRRSGSVGA